ncbi:acylphosphatase [Mycoplasmoides fastidiosum]|uniref:Acylphosphatase n=1 Tax=Mycoplasmoides fastidiosum TaxID=92758 RepID=A0ABU0LZ88_9BACT|nr:hypothetical protein [Mycoplasmoides fastidiosum]MDQ0514014.1 acylphosphatase [Mycoplasmoides fastidiosum]
MAVLSFVQSTSENSQFNLQNLLAAINRYQSSLNSINHDLRIISGVVLNFEDLISQLKDLSNTDASFASANKETLDHLFSKVDKNLYGRKGSDLSTPVPNDDPKLHEWLFGNVPANLNDQTLTTGIYKVLLKYTQQAGAWQEILRAIKILTFNQSLLDNNPVAVQLLANGINTDVSQEIEILQNIEKDPETNLVQVLEKQTTNQASVKSVIENLLTGTEEYNKYLLSHGDTPARMYVDLTSLKYQFYYGGGDFNKVNDLAQAIQSLNDKYDQFYRLWNELKSSLFVVDEDKTIHLKLIGQATWINKKINNAKSYAELIEIKGLVEYLKDAIVKITEAVSETTPLMKLLRSIIDDIQNKNSRFSQVLETFATTNDWSTSSHMHLSDGTSVTLYDFAKSIAHKDSNGQTSGYVYDFLIKKVKNTTNQVGQTLQTTFTELWDKLKQLKLNSTDQDLTTTLPLGKVLELIQNQFDSKIDYEIDPLNTQLALEFNNGNVVKKAKNPK